jgi:hypothetical protein
MVTAELMDGKGFFEPLRYSVSALPEQERAE